MRILAVVFLAVMLVASVCFAEGQSAVKAPEKAPAKASQEVTGEVDSINPIDPSRGIDEGSIIVMDNAGNAPIIIIDEKTEILDESSKKIDSADIDNGNRVKVTYAVSETGKRAIAISRLAK